MRQLSLETMGEFAKRKGQRSDSEKRKEFEGMEEALLSF